MIRIKVTPEQLELTKLMVYPVYGSMGKPMFISEIAYIQFIKSLPEVKVRGGLTYYV
jgi:hypothetical protein